VVLVESPRNPEKALMPIWSLEQDLLRVETSLHPILSTDVLQGHRMSGGRNVGRIQLF
jgi:hypothetical protein